MEWKKYAQNREDHCNDAMFYKMYDQVEAGLVASGHTVRYDNPVHKDKNGKIVDNESLAFGCLVTIHIVCPDNVFFLMKRVTTCMEKTMGTKVVRGKLFQGVKYQKNLWVLNTHIFPLLPSWMQPAHFDLSQIFLPLRSFHLSGLLG
jgi:hypothetical protein